MNYVTSMGSFMIKKVSKKHFTIFRVSNFDNFSLSIKFTEVPMCWLKSGKPQNRQISTVRIFGVFFNTDIQTYMGSWYTDWRSRYTDFESHYTGWFFVWWYIHDCYLVDIHVSVSLLQRLGRFAHRGEHSRVRVGPLQGLPLLLDRRQCAVNLDITKKWFQF